MKTTILTFLMTVAFLTTIAQDTTQTNKAKIYKNEFGIDATGFIKQFINFSQQQNYTEYAPTYYLTYRRHFKCGNLRFAIGGGFSDTEIPSGLTEGPEKYYTNSYSVTSRIGWEFRDDLTKCWQVFYGLDFIPTYYYRKEDAQYLNDGYATGNMFKSNNYGLAPILGFRYKLTSRLSIMTELNYYLSLQQVVNRTYYIPISTLYPSKPDENRKSKRVVGSFTQPLSLFIVFDI